MMRVNRARLASTMGKACICGVALLAAEAQAQQTPPQTASDATLGDIVVTARSKGETLQSVPVSVTALSSKTVARYASNDLNSIVEQVPQLKVLGGPASGTGGTFIIRGVGTSGSDPSFSQSVGLVLDNAQVNKAFILLQGMYDVEQVEILKGPQALFFGKNSPAGVISIRSKDPGDHLEGTVTGGYEFNARERYATAAFGGPITDTLGIRFAGRYSKMRGWVENVSRPMPDPSNPTVMLPGAANKWGPGTESYGGRVTIKFKPASNFTSTLKVSADRRTDNDALATEEVMCAAGHTHPVSSAGVVDTQNDCSLNAVRSSTALPPQYAGGYTIDPQWRSGVPFAKFSSMLATWKNTLTLGKMDIVSNTSYVKIYASLRGNASDGNEAEFQGGATSRYHSFDQELRIVSNYSSPLNFTVGGFFESNKDAEAVDLFLANLGPDPVTQKYASTQDNAEYTGKTYSAFGQLRYNIVPDVELSGGVRWTREEKDTTQSNTYVHTFLLGALSPPSRILVNRQSFNNWSPEATLTWHPGGTQTTLYAAFKTGYKSGGTSMPAVLTGANTIANLAYRPEKTIGGEIGYKDHLFGNRLRMDLTAYYYRYTGLQLTSFDAVTVSQTTQNAADATQKGIEGNFDFRATDTLSLRASFGYNELHYGSFTNAACYAYQTLAQGCYPIGDGGQAQDLSGKRLHRAPLFSADAGFTYEVPISDTLKIGLDSDVSYQTGAFTAENQNPTGYQGGYALVNASLHLGPKDRRWDLSLIGRNLTNKIVIGFSGDRPGGSAGEIQVNGSRTREIALQATINF